MGRHSSSSDFLQRALGYAVVLGIIFPVFMLVLFLLSGTSTSVAFAFLELYFILLILGAIIYGATWLEKKLK